MARFIRAPRTELRWRLCLPRLGIVTGLLRAGFASSSLPSRNIWERTLLETCSSGQRIEPIDHLGPDPKYQNEQEAHRWDDYVSPEKRLQHVNPHLCTIASRQAVIKAVHNMIGEHNDVKVTAAEYDNCNGSGHVWQGTNYAVEPNLLPEDLFVIQPTKKHPTKELENRFVHFNNPKHMAIFIHVNLPSDSTCPFVASMVYNLDKKTDAKVPQQLDGYQAIDEDGAALIGVIAALESRPPAKESCFHTQVSGGPAMPLNRNNMAQW